jgi:hypothetical protein
MESGTIPRPASGLRFQIWVVVGEIDVTDEVFPVDMLSASIALA